jgi:hypothetical protein
MTSVVVETFKMPNEGEKKPRKFKKWIYILLTAFGVGAIPAAVIAGCPSGVVADVPVCVERNGKGECVKYECEIKGSDGECSKVATTVECVEF